MSLATRCPSCGTVFRVVQDQLRVSEGWVRCGRCNGVFNASEVLFDIDSGAAVHLDLGLGGAGAGAGIAATDAGLDSARHVDQDTDQIAGRDANRTVDHTVDHNTDNVADITTDHATGLGFDQRFAEAAPPDFSAPPAEPAVPSAAPALSAWPDDGRREPHFDSGTAWTATGPAQPHGLPGGGSRSLADFSLREEPLLRTPSRHADDPAGHGEPGDADDPLIITDHVPGEDPALAASDLPHATAMAATVAAAMPDAAAGPPLQSLPSFMRTAERTALWRRPAMRAALGVGVLLLALALLAQAALLWRDALAARVPAAAPLLQGLCRVVGCSVQPLRRLESLTVGSSGLNRLEGSTVYRLQVVLHNRADTAVMMPALDLSLTDGAGKLVSRRVLQVAELGAPQPVLQAGEELPIKVLVSTGDRRIDGYTLELFYP